MPKTVRLTDAKIKSLCPPQSGRLEIVDALVPGLRIRLGRSGAKTFTVRKRIGSKIKNISIGRYGPNYSLADARKEARALLVDLENGIVPDKKTVRAPQIQNGRFAELWELYLEREVRGQKRSAREIERYGKLYLLPTFGNRLVHTITRSEVTRFVDDIQWQNPDKPKPRAALSSFQFLSAFYSWLLPQFDTIPANPCRDARRPKPSKPRERVLSDSEIRIFWKACDKIGFPYGTGYKLLLMTGQRRGEIFDASWQEFNGDIWTLPGERVKNGRTHVLPLPSAVLDIFNCISRKGGATKVFPIAGHPDKSLDSFSKGAARLRCAMTELNGGKKIENFRIHDLRRTVATGMQRLRVPIAVTEAVLNHVSGSLSGIASIYQRHDYLDEKREALQKWNKFLAKMVSD
jgi:integrase